MTGRARPFFTVAVYLWMAALLVVVCVVGTLLLPWTFAFDRDRRVVAAVVCWLIRTSLRVPRGWRRAVRGICEADLARPAVVVINHRSIADTALGLSIPGAARLAAKPWVRWIPLVPVAMWLSGHDAFEPSDVGQVRDYLDRSEARLRRGISVVVFPEGTRRTEPGLGRFSAGAFELAVRTGVDVLPVVFLRTGDLVPRGSVVFHDVEVVTRVLPRIPAGTDRAALLEKTRAAMLSALDDPPA